MIELNTDDLLDALSDPILLVEGSGTVKFINKAVTHLSSVTGPGSNLCQMAGSAGEDVRKFLQRSSGSTGPLLGVIYLPGPGETLQKLRVRARALSSPNDRLVFIQCLQPNDDKFLLLRSRVEALNAEIKQHLHTKAVLQEGLRERELLMRETHHRVKNNMQILYGIMSASENEALHPEAKRSLADVRRRVAAIAAVQQTLYRSDHQSYRADEFLESLVSQLQATWPPETRIEMSIGNGTFENDTAAPLALIVNELVTNAVKYGNVGDKSPVKISLYVDDDQMVLSVSDSGPGFAPGSSDRRSSGLGLVRGLARQLGGKFVVENREGAHCRLILFKRSGIRA